jgi:hypothetical protein
MSFKEIKSLLRMVNVDMNDMYAYHLFKVNPAPGPATTLLPPAKRNWRSSPSQLLLLFVFLFL